MIRALVFDFDGLMLETEMPVFQAWEQTYRDHGAELPFETWLETIGSADHEWDPFEHLQQLVGRRLDREDLARRRQRLRDSILHAHEIMPGVQNYLRDAGALGLKLAIASSSSRAWVTGHLARLGVETHWDAIRCSDDVAHTKPDPELYQSATSALGVKPDEALALEDSMNGVVAAKAAGLLCVAIPGPLTASMDFSKADMVLGSLADISLHDLLERLATGTRATRRDAKPV